MGALLIFDGVPFWGSSEGHLRTRRPHGNQRAAVGTLAAVGDTWPPLSPLETQRCANLRTRYKAGVGAGPLGVAVDESPHAIFVNSNGDGGRTWVINGVSNSVDQGIAGGSQLAGCRFGDVHYFGDQQRRR